MVSERYIHFYFQVLYYKTKTVRRHLVPVPAIMNVPLSRVWHVSVHAPHNLIFITVDTSSHPAGKQRSHRSDYKTHFILQG